MPTLDDSTFQSVNNGNFKNMAELPMLDTFDHRRRVQGILETGMAAAIDRLNNTSVPEGLGIAAANRSDLGKQIADLGAAIAGLQQMIKGAQTTPPATA